MTENMQQGQGAEVDMLAAAKDAQWSAGAFLGPGSLKLVSPAKVNLLLAIGARRDDGYHEVENIMHALALHDTIYLHTQELADDELARAAADLADAYQTAAECEGASVAPGGRARLARSAALVAAQAVGGPADNLLVSIDLADRTGQDLVVPAADNLAFKAADCLARVLGRTEPEKVSLRIEKHIPAQGGLGGGSSNAAAALVGLAQKWDVPADDPRVLEVAQGLGADVAFFLRGGCALFEGAGEREAHRLAPSNHALVLVKPPAGVSTAAAYRRFDEDPQPVPEVVLEVARAAQEAAEVPLANNLAPAAESLLPVLADIRTWLAEAAGPQNVLLCGSGATTFALVDSFDTARTLATQASARGWWGRPTNLSGLRAAVVPGR